MSSFANEVREIAEKMADKMIVEYFIHKQILSKRARLKKKLKKYKKKT